MSRVARSRRSGQNLARSGCTHGMSAITPSLTADHRVASFWQMSGLLERTSLIVGICL